MQKAVAIRKKGGEAAEERKREKRADRAIRRAMLPAAALAAPHESEIAESAIGVTAPAWRQLKGILSRRHKTFRFTIKPRKPAAALHAGTACGWR